MLQPTRLIPEYQALVVENELDFRSELIFVVESLDVGISVAAEASSFDDALAELDKGDIDLLITDINLNDTPRFDVGVRDGLELAVRARTHYDVPTIFLTAFADYDPAVINMAAAVDPIGFIQKQGDAVGSQTRDHLALAMRRLELIRQLRESRGQLCDVSEHLGSAALFVDDHGLVFDFNEEAAALLELPAEAMEEHHWEDVLHVLPRTTGHSEPLSRAMQRCERAAIPLLALQLPQQGILFCRVSITPTQHLRRSCCLISLCDIGDAVRAPRGTTLPTRSCLVVMDIELTGEDNERDAGLHAALLELQSIVTARLPSASVLTPLQPGELLIALENTGETDGQHRVAQFLLEAEALLLPRHSGVRLHAGLAETRDGDTASAALLGALRALETARRDPAKRVVRADAAIQASHG